MTPPRSYNSNSVFTELERNSVLVYIGNREKRNFTCRIITRSSIEMYKIQLNETEVRLGQKI